MTFGKDLKVKYNNESFNVTGTHDCTKKQREDYKKLSVELKGRIDAGEENIGIRNNRIVTNFRNQPSGAKSTWAKIASQ